MTAKKKGKDSPKDKKASRPLVGKCQLPGWEAIAAGVGRPTDYTPAYCDKIIELGRKGYSKAMMASELDVVRSTLDNWALQHPEFLDAMLRAREYSLAWWEAQGHLGIWSREFNANAYRLQVFNRFPDEFKTERQAEAHGEDAPPSPVKVEIVVKDARKAEE